MLIATEAAMLHHLVPRKMGPRKKKPRLLKKSLRKLQRLLKRNRRKLRKYPPEFIGENLPSNNYFIACKVL